MLIRHIRRTDNPAVASIIRHVMTEFGAVGPGFSIQDPEVENMSEAYAGDRSVFYVLEEGGELVGCGGIGPLKGGDLAVCELQKMYFLEQARGIGLGRLLVETLILDARRYGYKKIYIETLERMRSARMLYEKLGFKRLNKGLGATGHSGCDVYYALDVEPQELDPNLLR